MTVPFILSVAVIIGLFLFLLRETRHASPNDKSAAGWKRAVRIGLLLIPLAVACGIFWGIFIEPNRLITRQETITIDNWPAEFDGLRIVMMSDLHVGGPFIDDQKLRLLIERTSQLQPDLIVILGDYMTGEGRMRHRVLPEVFAPTLKELRAPLGVYSVLGNHDWWWDGQRVRRALEANGIKVLENEVLKVDRNGKSFWIAGLADLWTRQQNVSATIEQVPEGQTVIALTHNPDIFPRVPARVQLLLAGHTHGGQFSFPIIGSVVHASTFGYMRGHFFENTHHLFVTTGIGTSIIPARFGVTPEIVLLTVKSR